MKPNLKEFCQKFNISDSEIYKKEDLIEFEQLRKIKKCWTNIANIKNPTEEVRLEALTSSHD